MACMSKHHQELTDGVGKCSVPMWSCGYPAGFCDRPAYGRQAPVKRTWPSEFPPAFAPGLACDIHGGPAKKGE